MKYRSDNLKLPDPDKLDAMGHAVEALEASFGFLARIVQSLNLKRRWSDRQRINRRLDDIRKAG